MRKVDDLLVDLFNAYYSARGNKRNTRSALQFEICYERNLIELYHEIVGRSYHPRPSICFIVNKPVKREIFAADFRDRIVHHLIFNYIAPVFENQFINDSYSCRRGKGTHYGIKRVNSFIRSCSENYHSDCYILKMDVRGYFMSINRSLLFSIVEKKIAENTDRIAGNPDTILYLVRETIYHDPVDDCIFRSEMSEWVGLPPSKSLFHTDENKGLPIGNLTSQLFANIYLNELDHFMKSELKLKFYGRYVDDLVVVHSDEIYLRSIISKVQGFLAQGLALELHPKKIYLQHFTKGVVFLGAVIKPYRIYIASRTKSNFYQSVMKYNKLAASGHLSAEMIKEFICSMNSYLGIMKHYKTAKLREHILKEKVSGVWWKCFYATGRYRKLVRK